MTAGDQLGECERLPNEPDLEWAERVVITQIAALASHAHAPPRDVTRKLGVVLGPYLSASQGMKQALEQLNTRRGRLLNFFWSPQGKWLNPVLSGDDVLDILAPTATAFIGFVTAWQPLMDSFAEVVHVILAWRGYPLTKSDMSMVKLSERAKQADWPANLWAMRAAFTTGSAWYVDEIRRLRNEAVHARVHAGVMPNRRLRTEVIVELSGSAVADRLPLEQLVNVSIENYVLVAINAARGLRTLVVPNQAEPGAAPDRPEYVCFRRPVAR